MLFYNINVNQELVNFKEATLRGLGSEYGLFFPKALPHFEDIKTLLELNFINRSMIIAQALLGDELSDAVITNMVKDTFSIPAPIKPITATISALELFHGPTLAFKDFGARFMARAIMEFTKENNKPITILTATSGDTGAAVAHAFYGMPNVNVVILYPHQRISVLQEKLFCTLGGNIHTLAVKGDFDICQTLVKQCFADKKLVNTLGLNSANSINVSRLFAQCFYYFEAVAQMSNHDNLVIAVPCGNFGNLTAGLFAQHMGLPVKSFVAVTNSNDTVPRYLKTGKWEVRPTIATLSNAMDVSAPNNWSRIEELYKNLDKHPGAELRSVALDEVDTVRAMHELHELDYIAEPHSASAYAGLKACLKKDEQGIFLCTAHPAKFKQNIEEILSKAIPLPPVLDDVNNKTILSKIISAELMEVQAYLKNI